jgi:exonuclease III
MRLFQLLCFFLAPLFVNADTECPLTTNGKNEVASSSSTFRFVQYNAEWLFIDYYSAMKCPGDGCTWKTEADAETHLSYVADVIRDLNPDLINICEIEGCDELHMLNDQLNTSYTPFLKKGTDTGTGQNVGFLSKVSPLIDLYRTEEKVAYPISGSQCYTSVSNVSGSTGVSKHYITEFQVGNTMVALIGAHLLAIPTDPARCVQREGQAQVLQNVVAGYIAKRYEVMVVGDFNDYDDVVLDVNDNKPTSRVLSILKGQDGVQKGAYNLTNVAYRIQKEERYSDWWDSDNNCATNTDADFSMIDHVLVTQLIDSMISNVFIYHGYAEYCGKWNSDHYPLVVDFIHL